jgi:hypothetical protein
MHPIQRPLHIWQTWLQTPNHVGIWSYTETDAVYYARESDIRLGHDVHIGFHSRSDML